VHDAARLAALPAPIACGIVRGPRETFRRIQIAANTSLKTLEKLTCPRFGEKLI